jgi:hypothetical protein
MNYKFKKNFYFKISDFFIDNSTSHQPGLLQYLNILKWRHDIQHNDSLLNDIQRHSAQCHHNDVKHGIAQNDNKTVPLCVTVGFIMLSVILLKYCHSECHYAKGFYL